MFCSYGDSSGLAASSSGLIILCRKFVPSESSTMIMAQLTSELASESLSDSSDEGPSCSVIGSTFIETIDFYESGLANVAVLAPR